MIVDFNELSLCYKINKIDYGKAFDIKKGKYKVGVHLCFKDDWIKLLS